MKKIISAVLALVMLLSMAGPVSALWDYGMTQDFVYDETYVLGDANEVVSRIHLAVTGGYLCPLPSLIVLWGPVPSSPGPIYLADGRLFSVFILLSVNAHTFLCSPVKVLD